MKRIQSFVAATVLAVAISLSAHAGYIGSPGVTEPPPEQPISTPRVSDSTNTEEAQAAAETPLAITLLNLLMGLVG